MLSLKNMNDFQSVIKTLNLEVSEYQTLQFQKYLDFLLVWNERINLISRQNANAETILERHFLDSIVFLPEIKSLINQNPTILDVGSGAGFPAIPLAIMEPNWEFTLCESISKKAVFLSELIKHLELKNSKVENKRAELLKAKYDLITARAVAKLDELIKYSLPLLKKGGSLLAYKAKDIDEEVKLSEKLIKQYSLKLKIFSKELNSIERKLVVVNQP